LAVAEAQGEVASYSFPLLLAICSVQVEQARREELVSLRSFILLRGVITVIQETTPIFVGLLTFLFHTLVFHRPLSPSSGYTALSLFTLLRQPLSQFPNIVNSLVKAQASIASWLSLRFGVGGKLTALCACSGFFLQN